MAQEPPDDLSYIINYYNIDITQYISSTFGMMYNFTRMGESIKKKEIEYLLDDFQDLAMPTGVISKRQVRVDRNKISIKLHDYILAIFKYYVLKEHNNNTVSVNAAFQAYLKSKKGI